MARIDVEEKRRNKPNSSYKWWIIAVMVILVVILAWLIFSDKEKPGSDVLPDHVISLYLEKNTDWTVDSDFPPTFAPCDNPPVF